MTKEERNAKWREWYRNRTPEQIAMTKERKRRYAESGKEHQRSIKYYKAKKEAMATRPRPDLCEVCNQPPKGRKSINWDHCHNSNKFRGWLCSGCNLTLGAVNDDPDRLRKLIAYLAEHGHE